MKLSIIIPTYERPDELINLLGRLEQVIHQEEVIIVDDSKVELSINSLYTFKFPVTYIHRGEKLGVSSARNIGSESATGEYLLFFDDDDDFTADWLADFRSVITKHPDLVQCQMKVVSDNRVKEVVTNKKDDWKLVIPGCWMIKKSIFSQIGGFDIDLKFAENTELFFRLAKLNLSKIYIPKVNFIYFQSKNGGSQNLNNMNESITIILEKHKSTLSKETIRIYHQILGVNNLRFNRYNDAKMHLKIAYLAAPFKLNTFIRLLIAHIPPLAKKLYPINFKK